MPTRRSTSILLLTLAAGLAGAVRARAELVILTDGQFLKVKGYEADGEEARLEHLARDFDARIAGLRTSFGEIGDQRIIVMAALTLADELADGGQANIYRRRAQFLRQHGCTIFHEESAREPL